MKRIQLILIAVLALAARLQATTLDLGPYGDSYLRVYDYSEFNGMQFNGQTITVDLTFSTQVHLYQGTYPNLLIGLAFKTSGGESFMTGTGYVVDINGNPMIPVNSILGSANTTDVMFVGLFPCYYGLTQPTEIYGVHFDLTLPTLDATIIAGGIELYDDELVIHGHHTPGFRIGPHVPDNGSTLLLFMVALLPVCYLAYAWRIEVPTGLTPPREL